MTLFGKRLSEYVDFVKVLLVVIVLVGVARLALSLAGVPNGSARWLSVTVAVWLSVLYAAVRAHTSGFGSYKQLLPVVALLNAPAQAVAIAAILVAMATGQDNIFSAPEYAFGGDGKTWAHALAHLFIGMTVGSLFYWLGACLAMFVAKRFAGREKAAATARA